MDRTDLFGQTEYELLLDRFYRDRQKRLNGKELSFSPSSIWDIPIKNHYLVEMIKDKAEIKEIKRTGGALGPGGLRFSEFKPDIAERVIEFWSNDGDLIVDPFAGRATRAIVAAILNRYYLGYEIIPDYRDFTMERCLHLTNGLRKRIDIRLGDGCELREVRNNSVDLIFTCPPYWNLEKYKTKEGQLSDCKTYSGFLERIEVALNNCYRVLKYNHFLCWVVADWFLDNKFYPFHRDIMTLVEQSGFFLHDVVIIKVYSPFVTISSGQNKRARRMGKQHEYLIVARK